MTVQRRWQGWAFVGPALLVTLALFAAPMVMVALTSLYRRDGGTTIRTITFDNYVRIFTDATIHQALWNSLEVVALTVVVSTIIAYPFAYIIAKKVPAKWQPLLLLLTVIPFWTSYVVRSYSWLLVLAKSGVINRTLVNRFHPHSVFLALFAVMKIVTWSWLITQKPCEVKHGPSLSKAN